MSALELNEEPWFAVLAQLAEDIVPSDDLPGAREAGTAQAVAATLTEPGQIWLVGGIEALARLGYGDMSGDGRRTLLTLLARGTRPAGWVAADPRPERFWAAIRSMVVAAFFAGEHGRQVTKFPGPSVAMGGHRAAIVEPRPR